MEELKEKLKKLASRQTYSDKEDFCAIDISGGNFDDGFRAGMEEGETFLAQEILSILNKI